jgi:hypothetical protein
MHGAGDRAKMPTTSNTALAKKGSRQPQDAKSALGNLVANANASDASTSPTGKPIWTKLA